MSILRHDTIMYNKRYYYTDVIKHTEMADIIYISPPSDKFSLNIKFNNPILNTNTICLPLPDPTEESYPLPFISSKKYEFKLDLGLFRALCIRNLTGNMSSLTLSEFSVGYAVRKFIVVNKTIRNPHLASEILRIHVLLSEVAISKLHSTASYTMGLQNIINKIPYLKNLLLGMMNNTTKMILSRLIAFLSDMTGKNIEQLL